MLSGFKFYLLLVFVLIGAHVVVAGEKVVDFQRALNDFRKDRKPQIAETQVRDTF